MVNTDFIVEGLPGKFIKREKKGFIKAPIPIIAMIHPMIINI